jgi:hypothetical protein
MHAWVGVVADERRVAPGLIADAATCVIHRRGVAQVCLLLVALGAAVGCGPSADARPSATYECRLALGAVAIRDSVGRVAMAVRARSLDEAVAGAQQVARDGQALMDVADERPQDDVARAFGMFGQDAFVGYEGMDSPGDLLDAQTLTAAEVGTHDYVDQMILGLPRHALDGCQIRIPSQP